MIHIPHSHTDTFEKLAKEMGLIAKPKKVTKEESIYNFGFSVSDTDIWNLAAKFTEKTCKLNAVIGTKNKELFELREENKSLLIELENAKAI